VSDWKQRVNEIAEARLQPLGVCSCHECTPTRRVVNGMSLCVCSECGRLTVEDGRKRPPSEKRGD